MLHDIKETTCHICKKTDKDTYMVCVSSDYPLTEITCEDCYIKEVKKRLKKLIDEEL